MSKLDEMLAKTGMREAGFRCIIDNLPAHDPRIVETGCADKPDNWRGGGMSTLIWDAVAEERDGLVASFDISPSAAAFADTHTSSRTTVARGDAVRMLSKTLIKVSLLYLDSLDVDFQNPHVGAMQALMEFTAGRHILSSGSLVAVDDNIVEGGQHRGKGTYLADYFDRIGVKPIYQEYQWVWRLP